MKNQLNLKLENNDYDTLEFIARDQNLKVTSLATSIFLAAFKEFRIQKSIEMYQKGEMGLKEAWLLSGLTFIDFFGELKDNDIDPPLEEELDEYTEKNAEGLKF